MQKHFKTVPEPVSVIIRHATRQGGRKKLNRRNSRRKRQKKRKVQELIQKLGTLNIVLICVFMYMMYINWKMLAVFSQCGSAPESAWCALIAALLGECGICGWIKTSKEKHRRKQDYENTADPVVDFQGDAGINEGMEDEE